MAATGKYYNNGIINKRIPEGEPIPDGFTPGMKPRSKEYQQKINEKRKKTNKERYGVEHPLQSYAIKENMKQNSLKKWGVEHPMQSDTMKEKYKQIFINKYGVDNPIKAQEVQEKIKQTNLSKLGVERPAQSKEVRDKMKSTTLERYGVENAFQSKDLMEKAKQSMLDHYGVEHALQSKEIQEKQKKTNIERYGVENAMQSKEIRDKGIQTNLSRYGVENPFQSEEVKAKIKQKSLQRYGTEYPNQSEEVKNKIVDTSIKHWGTSNPMQNEEVKDKLHQIFLDKFGVDSPMQLEEVRAKLSNTCNSKYGVQWPCQLKKVYTNNSAPNRAFAHLLDRNKIIYDREFPLKNYSFDFKIGNILVEIDPFATHNTLWTPFNPDKGIPSDYHYKKSNLARNHGYHCIHIFDWDDTNKIINLLKQGTIQLEDTELSEIYESESNLFLNRHSLYGSCKNSSVRICLKHQGRIVSLMVFKKEKSEESQWTLLRNCQTQNIEGTTNKIFNYFIREYNPESIIAYCDNAKFSGEVYKDLGFSFISESKPNKHWYTSKREDMQHITDSLLQRVGFDNLFHVKSEKGLSNKELIIQRGYVPIYDCGFSTYKYMRKEI